MTGFTGDRLTTSKKNLLIICCLCTLAVWETVVIWVLFHDLNKPNFFCGDFVAIYAGASLAMSPWRSHLYDPAVQYALISHLPDLPDKVYVLQYPPYAWLLLSPLSLLPLKLSYIVFDIFSAIVGLGALALVVKHTQKFTALQVALFVALTLASLPANYALRVGQLSFIMLALLALLYYAWQHNRQTLIGVTLAIVSLKPQFLLLFFPGLLAQKKWKAIGWFVTVELLLLLLAGLVFGWSNLLEYPFYLSRVETMPIAHLLTVSPHNMASLRGILSWFLPKSTAFQISVLSFLAILPALYIFWRKVRPAGMLSVAWMFALTIVAYLALSPHLHSYDCVLLSLAAALTLPDLSKGLEPLRKTRAFYFWTLLLLSYPVLSWLLTIVPFEPPSPDKHYPLFALPNLIALALALVHTSKFLRPQSDELRTNV